MPTSWVLSIAVIFGGLFYGLLIWQRHRIDQANEFLVEVKSELKKVTWPGRREVINTTTVVIVTVFFFGIYLSVVDFVVLLARQALFKVVGLGG